jgi:CDP-glucose 4,6-dehydratase
MLLQALYEKGNAFASAYNIGPDDADCVPVEMLANLFCKYWPGAKWEYQPQANAVHEANFLKLDCSKIRNELGYAPRWNIEKAIQQTVEWSLAGTQGEDMFTQTQLQIRDYFTF